MHLRLLTRKRIIFGPRLQVSSRPLPAEYPFRLNPSCGDGDCERRNVESRKRGNRRVDLEIRRSGIRTRGGRAWDTEGTEGRAEAAEAGRG